MRMVKIENERNTFMETHSERREESSPTIIASKKSLRFVNVFHGTHHVYSFNLKTLNGNGNSF